MSTGGSDDRRAPVLTVNRSAVGLGLAAFLIMGVVGWIGGMPRAAELRSSSGTVVTGEQQDAGVPTSSVRQLGGAGQVASAASALPPLDPAWTAEVAAATGIPSRALEAYAGAALATSIDNPQCGLGWNTLAAIGFVESAHGTIGGGTLDASGLPSTRIVGVPLDGISAASIPDSDAGTIDGDTTVDRAVGPMQFIPDSWKRHGVDASGDGVADPNQIDDAALTAARYLCVAGGNLATAEGWNTAVLAYNADPAYVAQTSAKADAYAVAAQ